jgi:hypothetical protein
MTRFSVFVVTVFLLFYSITAACQSSPPSTGEKGVETAPKETHLSAAEAEELFKSLDDIMKFASDDSGLPIRSSIKRELGDRDQVVKYIQQKMEEDEDTKRFERTELVLKKFGMLPVDFQLRPFLLKLLREQVAGFYDSKTKTMHLLDWLSAETQRPVMAHELTHALQDQTVDLEKWTGLLTDAAKKAGDPVNAEINNDEDSTARSAVVEGQGTAVMIDYILLPMGKSLETSPELGEYMKNAMGATEGMSVLSSAPILLRESLTFPYREGLGFVQALLKSGGKKKAFADALKDPPHTTHDILHPEDYLAHKPSPVMHMPDLTTTLGKSYEKYDVGSIGEFDLSILFKQFGDDRSVKELTPQWRGGMYFAALKTAQNPKTSAKNTLSPSDVALLYVSHWPSPAIAQQFAAAYSQTIGKRYGSPTKKECANIANCSTWNTADGPVSVQAIGSAVIALEGFDEKTAASLRKSLVANEANTDPAKSVAVASGNLSSRVSARYFTALSATHQR